MPITRIVGVARSDLRVDEAEEDSRADGDGGNQQEQEKRDEQLFFDHPYRPGNVVDSLYTAKWNLYRVARVTGRRRTLNATFWLRCIHFIPSL